MVTRLPMSRPPPSPRVSKQAVTRAPSAAVQETMTVTQMRSSGTEKPPRQLRRLPPISVSGGAKADRKNNTTATASTESAERAAKAWMRQALEKRVATRMLKRSTAPPPVPGEGSRGGGRKVLACCCARLPPGLSCALHQAGAPGRAWMHAHRRRGGEDKAAVVVVAPPRACGWAFSEYARWRRHVWMPSRFYLEHHVHDAEDEHRAAASSYVHGMRVDL